MDMKCVCGRGWLEGKGGDGKEVREDGEKG